jgi:hypothetical protein
MAKDAAVTTDRNFSMIIPLDSIKPRMG